MTTDTIITTITKTIDNLGVPHNGVEVVEVVGQTLYSIKVDKEHSGKLIGNRGDAIRALNTIVRKLLERLDITERVSVDVNDYKKSKLDKLITTAQMYANRARELRYDVELQPMNAYERMIVHASLADDSDIETGSVGEGPDRRVVIKFVG